MEFGKGKIEWLEFDLLEPYTHISHGVFLRRGGLSKGACASLNVGFSTSDDKEAVLANREEIRKVIDTPVLLFPHQNHSNSVERVTAKNIDKTFHADALFTQEKNIAIGVVHADCQAAIFYDPMHEAIAVVHAGWRGLVQNIYARVLDEMQRQIGTKPQNVLVCTGPSLGPDHAEYKSYKQDFPKDFWEYQVKPFHFDFWAIAKNQLCHAGVLEKNLEQTQLCTYCNPKEYFSHRRDKDTGRHATVVALKS